ncbi:DNA damage-binding protein 2 [Elysia marginata]|uniref:Damage-specific DNA-binding protein 2 n=1 Tax=Elysia marginata TaxID=1093978 RepID=A0AAV4FK09_9GAST|nr:DNA damage-binding protein 2 [Elysia marginata]
MGPKTVRVTRSSQNSAHTAAEAYCKPRSSRTKKMVSASHEVENVLSYEKLEQSSSKLASSKTGLIEEGSRCSESEVKNIDDVEHRLNSSKRRSRTKSTASLKSSLRSSHDKKHDDILSQPLQCKKQRFDSGDSFSELPNILSRSDLGFETESNISAMSPTLQEARPESGIEENEYQLELSDLQDAKLSVPVCSRLWPSRHDKCMTVPHYFSNRSLGRLSPVNKKAVTDQRIVSSVAECEVLAHDKPFGSRVTTIDWHPRKQNFFCATSKHGDLAFYQLDAGDKSKLEPLKLYSGIGPGGYISAFKFHPIDNERFYTSTLEGKVVLGNTHFGGNHVEKVLLSTGTWDFWYCAMDVSPVENFVLSGRNNGMTVMCTTSGQPIWQLRLHSKKVTHVELSPREPHVFCTASLDHSVRIWDLRMLREVKGKPLPLDELGHEKGVNSAYFSLTDGTRLLTTDQHDQIRVYRAPFWHLETTILHPHRFFRHLTPHKAAWHPLADKIVIGRYPGDASRPEFGLERTIDMFDAATGKMHCELKDTRFNGLVSLCKFNNAGDMLLSAMGFQINLWWNQPDDDMKEDDTRARGIMVPWRPNSSGQRRRKTEEEKFSKIKLSKKMQAKK